MQKPVKNDISFNSADGRSRIVGAFYQPAHMPPFCVLQIAHGMCEHHLRYEAFAEFCCANGVAVAMHTHLGHGASAPSEADLGFFGEKGGRRFALEDMHTLNTLAREQFAGVPVVLLGHSMGSFFARQYAVQWPESIDGLIISGSAGPNPLAGVGIGLASLLGALRGAHYRPALLHSIAFGAYLKRIPSPRTPYDWISRDEAIVNTYANDPFCTFRFTANGFHELFSALRDVSSPQWAAGISKHMPVLMIQGEEDPVGAYGKGTATVAAWLREAGVQNLTYIAYPGGRHEMLNETNRAEVYADVLAFLQQWQPQNRRTENNAG